MTQRASRHSAGPLPNNLPQTVNIMHKTIQLPTTIKTIRNTSKSLKSYSDLIFKFTYFPSSIPSISKIK